MKKTEKQIREEIKQYYLENPDTDLTAADVAVMFNFREDLSQSQRGVIVRGLKKQVAKSSNWVPKSKWEVQKKGGEIVVLNSWRAKESEHLEKWEDFKESLVERLSSMTPEFLADVKYEAGDCLAELNITDFHFGKVEVEYRSLDQQCEDYLSAIKVLVQKVKGFSVDKYLLVVGNDLFHVDGANSTTTRGTAMPLNADWEEVYSKGLETVIKAVIYLSKYNPVDVIIVQGNHDKSLTFSAGEALRHYFSQTKTVNIFNPIGKERKYYTYGKCLIGYTHGNNEKQADLPIIMAVEEPEAFAKCPYRYWRTGHLHHSIVKEYQGIEVETLGALSRTDLWHKRFGYLSKPKAQVVIFNKNSGKEGQFIFNDY